MASSGAFPDSREQNCMQRPWGLHEECARHRRFLVAAKGQEKGDIAGASVEIILDRALSLAFSRRIQRAEEN
jgi:hypothetical protein